MTDTIITSGRSITGLAKTVSRSLHLPFVMPELSLFPNQELKIRITTQAKKAFLFQSFSYPVNSHIIEYCLIADALHHQGVEEIIGIIPWLGYSKQDKIFREGEPLSASVIARVLQTTQTTQIISVDLHSPRICELYHVPLVNIIPIEIFANYISDYKLPVSLVVSPDAGSRERSQAIADYLGLPLIKIDKQRDRKTGEVTVTSLSEDVEDKDLLIFDDLIATGDTAIQVAKNLKDRGARSIIFAASHHLFIEGVQEKLDASSIDKVIISDTIPVPDHIDSKKLKIVSVAPLLAAHVELLK